LGIAPPAHLKASKRLLDKIERSPGLEVKVITLVREPIARDISDFFQNIRRHPRLVDTGGEICRLAAMEHLLQRFRAFDESTDYACNWFDRELKQVFGVDVYAHPFSYKEGYTILTEGNVSVLLLRLEDLDRCFSQAIGAFLGLERALSPAQSNLRARAEHAEAYRYVLDNIAVPRPVCVRIYSSRHAKHFYSKDARDKLISRWSREPDPGAGHQSERVE
jgi:hypothetical protein